MRVNNMKIKEWVREQYDNDELRNIADHGCVSGCASGLIYYNETTAFYDKFTDEIWDMLYQQMNDMGETQNIMQFIAQFNGADNVGSDHQFKNLLCWYAVEEIAHELLGEIESDNQ